MKILSGGRVAVSRISRNFYDLVSNEWARGLMARVFEFFEICVVNNWKCVLPTKTKVVEKILRRSRSIVMTTISVPRSISERNGKFIRNLFRFYNKFKSNSKFKVNLCKWRQQKRKKRVEFMQNSFNRLAIYHDRRMNISTQHHVSTSFNWDRTRFFLFIFYFILLAVGGVVSERYNNNLLIKCISTCANAIIHRPVSYF